MGAYLPGIRGASFPGRCMHRKTHGTNQEGRQKHERHEQDKAGRNGIVEMRKGLDLTREDILQLLSIYADNGGKDTNAAFQAVSSAYYAGLAVGMLKL